MHKTSTGGIVQNIAVNICQLLRSPNDQLPRCLQNPDGLEHASATKRSQWGREVLAHARLKARVSAPLPTDELTTRNILFVFNCSAKISWAVFSVGMNTCFTPLVTVWLLHWLSVLVRTVLNTDAAKVSQYFSILQGKAVMGDGNKTHPIHIELMLQMI